MNINHLFSCLAFLGESILRPQRMAMSTGNRQSAVDRIVRQNSANNLCPVYITQKIAYYDFLDEDALAAIEAQAYTAQRKEAMLDA